MPTTLHNRPVAVKGARTSDLAHAGLRLETQVPCQSKTCSSVAASQGNLPLAACEVSAKLGNEATAGLWLTASVAEHLPRQGSPRPLH